MTLAVVTRGESAIGGRSVSWDSWLTLGMFALTCTVAIVCTVILSTRRALSLGRLLPLEVILLAEGGNLCRAHLVLLG
jgi:hypothetical protein